MKISSRPEEKKEPESEVIVEDAFDSFKVNHDFAVQDNDFEFEWFNNIFE